jgi:hypothetical protein
MEKRGVSGKRLSHAVHKPALAVGVVKADARIRFEAK